MSNKIRHVFIVEADDYNNCNIEELKQEFNNKGYNYMLFMRSYEGKEIDIVKKCCIFYRKEKLRFYACGNFEIVEGIIKGLDGYENRELAFCPLDNDKGMLKNLEENYVGIDINAFVNDELKCIV